MLVVKSFRYIIQYLRRSIVIDDNILYKILEINKKWKNIIQTQKYCRNFHLKIKDLKETREIFKSSMYLNLCFSIITKSCLKDIYHIGTLDLYECHHLYNDYLCDIKTVDKLILSNSYIDDIMFRNVDSIYSLELNYCDGITGDGIIKFKMLKTLKLIGCCRITDNCLKHLTNIENLKIKDCGDNITDIGIKYLKKLKKLELINHYSITDEGLKSLENIDTLIMYNNNISKTHDINDKITDEGIKSLKRITKLCLRGGCKWKSVTDEGIKNLRYLKEFEMNGSENITDNTFKNFKGIEKIVLSGSIKISDKFLDYLTGVKVIDINIYKNDVTDDGILKLRNLKHLTIRHNENITKDAFKNLKAIKHIKIIRCKNIPRNSTRDLYDMYKRYIEII